MTSANPNPPQSRLEILCRRVLEKWEVAVSDHPIILNISAPPLPLPGLQLRPPREPQFKSRESERSIMLGEQIGETKGRRLVRRVITIDPPTAEVSFEDTGQ